MKHFKRVIATSCIALVIAAARGGSAASPASGPSEWNGLDFSHFADLAITKACSPEARHNKGLNPDFVQFAWDHYLSKEDQLKAASPNSMFKLMSAVLTKFPKERKAELAKLYYKVVLQDKQDLAKVDGPRLVLVGWVLISSGLYDQNQSFPEFAKAVAAHVKEKEHFEDDVKQLQVPASDPALSAEMTYLNPFWYQEMRETLDDAACPFYRSLFADSAILNDYSACYFFGKALGTDADRQILRDELIKPECGCPRLGPAKVLTWSYRRLNQLDKWQAFIDGKINDTSAPQEPRAKWLLVRGYTDESAGYFPSPWLSKKWIEKALAIDPPQPVRQECIEALVERYLIVGHFDDGIAFLKQQGALANSQGVQETIGRLTDELQKAKDKTASAQKASDQRQERERLVGEIATLRSRLADAKAAGSEPAQITSLENSVKNVQHQLESLGSGATATTQPASGSPIHR